MQLILDKRKTGKTMKLMQACIENNGIFITSNSFEADGLRFKYGYKHIYSFKKNHSNLYGLQSDDLYIDDIDVLIENTYGLRLKHIKDPALLLKEMFRNSYKIIKMAVINEQKEN